MNNSFFTFIVSFGSFLLFAIVPVTASVSHASSRVPHSQQISVISTEPPKVTISDPNRFNAADQAFKERHIENRAREALRLYRKFFEETPNDPQAAWRVSMGCYFVGIRLTNEDKEKKKIYAEGRDVGLKSIELDQKCAPCHFWTAINMALYGQTVGVLKMLFSLREIEDHLNASIKIDQTYAYAGAYRLLGKIEENLPGILGGSKKEAKEWYLKAINYGSDEPLNYLFLARLLESEFKDRKAALEFAKRGLNVPPPGPERLEARDAIKDLEKFISDHPVM